MGLEPGFFEARCISTGIDRDHHEEYVSILWFILPVGNEEYPRNQEKIIHPIDHYLLPEVYPSQKGTENIDREKYARNRPKELMSVNELDRRDSEDDHPDELGKWMGDNLSTKDSLPVDHRIHTEDDEGENGEDEGMIHVA